MALFVAGAFAGSAWAQEKGEIVAVDGVNYEIISENLITNGSFDDGVNGWYQGSWVAAATAGKTVATEGGFDGGSYLTITAGGASDATNLRGKWQVEQGKKYLFRVYTSGSTPSSNNLQYSKLYASAEEGSETSSIHQLIWPAAAGQTSNEWLKNEIVFDATTSWLAYRTSWTSGAKLDGFFLAEVEIVEPDLSRVGDFNGSIVDLQDFNVGDSDYTLEVQGEIGTEITIASENIKYTPTSNGVVRFVKYKGSAYVYEGSEYKGVVASNKAVYTYSNTLTNDDPLTNNLLQNPSFETVGDQIVTNKYKFGTPWETNVTETEKYIRVGTGGTHGTYVVVWRGSGNNNYFSQKVSSLKPFKGYKVFLSQIATGNTNAYFNIGIGNEVGDYSILSKTIRLGTNTGHKIHELELGSIANISEGFFTFRNTSNNTAESGSDPVTQIDWIGLVASDNFELEGVESATVLYGTAYAPENLDKEKAELEVVKSQAEESLSNDEYKNVVGVERSELQEFIEFTPNETVEAYVNAIESLNNAIGAFINAKTNYDALVAEIAKAKALGIDATTADSYTATEETTAAAALANTQALKVLEYNYVADTYAHEVELGDWTTTGPTGSKQDQHYSGNNSSYLEQSETAWSSSAWEIKYEQDLLLPSGNYVFKVAGRRAVGTGNTMSLIVTNVTDAENSVELGSVADFPEGDTGLGINKNGVTSFDANDEAGFANNNNGCGWEWRYVRFSLTEESTVKVAVNAKATTNRQWVSFCDATVQTDDDANISMIKYNIAKRDADAIIVNADYEIVAGATRITLQDAIAMEPGTTTETIDAATDALTRTIAAFKEALGKYQTLQKAITDAATATYVNVGVNAFQHPQDAANALNNESEKAKATLTSETATITDVETATAALQSAITKFNETPLNAPQAPLVLKLTQEGFKYNSNAVTFSNDKDGAGNHNLTYLYAENANYGQAIIFTPVEGETNVYTMSFIAADGDVRYICTGVPYGGTTQQIRVTTNADDALKVRVDATATEGIVKFYNTAHKAYIGSNGDQGVYTDNRYTNFTVSEAKKAAASLKITAAGWATIILPFECQIPDGVTAYTCEDAVDGVLSLTKVEDGVFSANIPYLIEGAKTELELTGYGTAFKDNYTEGLLVGTYVDYETTANSNTYVLQNKNEVVAFYLVGESAQPWIRANRCYMSYEAAAGAPMFSFGRGEGTTSIDNAQLTNDNVVIYDLAGRRVEKMEKGIYIVNGRKVIR